MQGMLRENVRKASVLQSAHRGYLPDLTRVCWWRSMLLEGGVHAYRDSPVASSNDKE